MKRITVLIVIESMAEKVAGTYLKLPSKQSVLTEEYCRLLCVLHDTPGRISHSCHYRGTGITSLSLLVDIALIFLAPQHQRM